MFRKSVPNHARNQADLLFAVFGTAPAGLGLRAPRHSFSGRVCGTCFFARHPRRAVITPYFIIRKWVVLCASVEITIFPPRSRAIRKGTLLSSGRSGWALD